MKKKVFKLGEVCQGGIIEAQVKGNKVTIIGREWDMSQGTRKGSNQSNAKEFTRIERNSEDNSAERALSDFLNELTTSYHSEEVMKWVKQYVKFPKSLYW
jgi:hypothetical protein